MADIVVKNNANTTVTLKDVSELVLPTADGGTAVFRQWNGADRYDHHASVGAIVGRKTSATVIAKQVQIPTVTITEG